MCPSGPALVLKLHLQCLSVLTCGSDGKGWWPRLILRSDIREAASFWVALKKHRQPEQVRPPESTALSPWCCQWRDRTVQSKVWPG